jgi:uncharacterized MnhB-related membrane protein
MNDYTNSTHALVGATQVAMTPARVGATQVAMTPALVGATQVAMTPAPVGATQVAMTPALVGATQVATNYGKSFRRSSRLPSLLQKSLSLLQAASHASMPIATP